jgi:5-hydroxyisourate hydrolase
MSSITCHVLDTALGRPAAGVQVRLERRDPTVGWLRLSEATTNSDGRVARFEPALALVSGEHRISFETGAYFAHGGRPVFYPRVEVTFVVASPSEHYHIPLLLSPFGYSTYRGS